MRSSAIAGWVAVAVGGVLVSNAAGEGVVLAPSAISGASVSAKGEPLFSPDGQMVYVQDKPCCSGERPEFPSTYATNVFARDPQSGTLSSLTCRTASGGTRCPPDSRALAISPDGQWLYALGTVPSVGSASWLQVFRRDTDGTLTQVQCLVGLGGEAAQPGCVQPGFPNNLNSMAITSDGALLYVAGPSPDLLVFARDQSSGRLTFTDCVAREPQQGAGHPAPACREDPTFTARNDQLVVAGRDAYLYSSVGQRDDAEVVYGYRPDAQTGRLAQTTLTPKYKLGEMAAAPDGLHVYAARGGTADLVSFPRDPTTGQLGTPTCFPARTGVPGQRSACPGHRTRGTNAITSLAVSPDGQTIVTSMSSDNLTAGGSPARVPPGGGISEEVVTYSLDGGGTPRAVGCIGDSNGCAPPLGSTLWIRFPATGPGPYLATQQQGSPRLRLLAPAPTLHVHAFSLNGRNPATLSCPGTRAQACRGTVEITRLSVNGSPVRITSLQRVSYRVAPGASRRILLRLNRRSRRSFLAMGRLAQGGKNPYVAVGTLIRVHDATRATTPSGVTACPQPGIPHVSCIA